MSTFWIAACIAAAEFIGFGVLWCCCVVGARADELADTMLSTGESA